MTIILQQSYQYAHALEQQIYIIRTILPVHKVVPDTNNTVSSHMHIIRHTCGVQTIHIHSPECFNKGGVGSMQLVGVGLDLIP